MCSGIGSGMCTPDSVFCDDSTPGEIVFGTTEDLDMLIFGEDPTIHDNNVNCATDADVHIRFGRHLVAGSPFITELCQNMGYADGEGIVTGAHTIPQFCLQSFTYDGCDLAGEVIPLASNHVRQIRCFTDTSTKHSTPTVLQSTPAVSATSGKAGVFTPHMAALTDM